MPYGTYLPRGCLYLPSPNRLDKLPEKPHGERSTGRAGSASVYVTGAGNSAGQGMMHLSKYASRVTLFGTLRLFNRPACPSTSSRRLEFQRIRGSPLTLRLSTAMGRDSSSTSSSRTPPSRPRRPYRRPPCSSSSELSPTQAACPRRSNATRRATLSPVRTSPAIVICDEDGTWSALPCLCKQACRAPSP